MSAFVSVFDVRSDYGIHVHFVVEADDVAVVICEFGSLDGIEFVVILLAQQVDMSVIVG